MPQSNNHDTGACGHRQASAASSAGYRAPTSVGRFPRLTNARLSRYSNTVIKAWDSIVSRIHSIDNALNRMLKISFVRPVLNCVYT